MKSLKYQRETTVNLDEVERLHQHSKSGTRLLLGCCRHLRDNPRLNSHVRSLERARDLSICSWTGAVRLEERKVITVRVHHNRTAGNAETPCSTIFSQNSHTFSRFTALLYSISRPESSH